MHLSEDLKQISNKLSISAAMREAEAELKTYYLTPENITALAITHVNTPSRFTQVPPLVTTHHEHRYFTTTHTMDCPSPPRHKAATTTTISMLLRPRGDFHPQSIIEVNLNTTVIAAALFASHLLNGLLIANGAGSRFST